MPTKRRPIKRDLRQRITPEAVAAYIADDDALLHELLGLKPWEESPLDVGDENTNPPGTAAYESWPKARALRDELEALAKRK